MILTLGLIGRRTDKSPPLASSKKVNRETMMKLKSITRFVVVALCLGSALLIAQRPGNPPSGWQICRDVCTNLVDGCPQGLASVRNWPAPCLIVDNGLEECRTYRRVLWNCLPGSNEQGEIGYRWGHLSVNGACNYGDLDCVGM